MAVDLNNCKLKIFEYVESRMAFIAPNLSVIVGASTAAKIMGMLKKVQFVNCSKLKLNYQQLKLTWYFIHRCCWRTY